MHESPTLKRSVSGGCRSWIGESRYGATLDPTASRNADGAKGMEAAAVARRMLSAGGVPPHRAFLSAERHVRSTAGGPLAAPRDHAELAATTPASAHDKGRAATEDGASSDPGR